MSWADPAPEDEVRCCRFLEFGADGAEMFRAFLDFCRFWCRICWFILNSCHNMLLFDVFLFEMLFWEKISKAPQTWDLPGGGEVQIYHEPFTTYTEYTVWGIPKPCKSVKIIMTIFTHGIFINFYYPRFLVFEQDPVYTVYKLQSSYTIHWAPRIRLTKHSTAMSRIYPNLENEYYCDKTKKHTQLKQTAPCKQ